MQNNLRLVLHAGLSAFVIYFSMYAFRKPFAAATFEGLEMFGMGFKVLLVISQVVGYALSKFIGIRFISGLNHQRRATSIILFILLAEMALLGFALAPKEFKFIFLFLNGIPLGMIWGLVFSYLEGRTVTELLAALLTASYIMASGMTKSIGKYLMNVFGVTEFWMPFCTGASFLLPLFIGVWLIEKVPPPQVEDIRFRKKRVPMNKEDRRRMIIGLAPGLTALTMLLFLTTAFRDLRDNFSAELWEQLGYGNSAAVFSQTEIFITLGILVALSLFVLIKNNLQALLYMQILMGGGLVILLVSTLVFEHTRFNSPLVWMTLSGLGAYLAYVPMGSMVFERISAVFDFKSNAGFLIYVADAFSYLGSVGILLVKEIFYKNISVYEYFIQIMYVIGIVGLGCTVFAFFYFKKRAYGIEQHDTGNPQPVPQTRSY
jgi:hypothetical protein